MRAVGVATIKTLYSLDGLHLEIMHFTKALLFFFLAGTNMKQIGLFLNEKLLQRTL